MTTEDVYAETQQTKGALRDRVVFAAQRDVAESYDPLDVPTIAFREGWCRVLMFAILDYWFERPATKKFRSARDWIFYPDNAPNSFDNVAQFLGLQPDAVRRAIGSRRSEFATDPRGTAKMKALLYDNGNATRSLLRLDDDEVGDGSV